MFVCRYCQVWTTTLQLSNVPELSELSLQGLQLAWRPRPSSQSCLCHTFSSLFCNCSLVSTYLQDCTALNTVFSALLDIASCITVSISSCRSTSSETVVCQDLQAPFREGAERHSSGEATTVSSCIWHVSALPHRMRHRRCEMHTWRRTATCSAGEATERKCFCGP